MFLTAMLADALLALILPGWAFTFLNILLLILLIGLANWLEVPWVVRHLEACLAWMTKKMGNNDTESE